jgi:flagellar hook-basal body complex protein FliE
MPIATGAAGSVFGVNTAADASVASAAPGVSGAADFAGLAAAALREVSAAQGSAASAEAGYAAGAPGATVGRALVASDRAEISWNATVAVRNEIVSAYQSIMNMQF